MTIIKYIRQKQLLKMLQLLMRSPNDIIAISTGMAYTKLNQTFSLKVI
jgi:trehalose-6-phosphatase